MQLDLGTALNVAGYGAFIVAGVLYARSKVPSQTIKNYKDLAESQEKRIKALEDQSKADQKNHLENIRAIADLQGQIKVYKELPLQEMATAMQRISSVNEGIAESNKKILEQLQSSADTLAEENAHKPSKITTTVITK